MVVRASDDAVDDVVVPAACGAVVPAGNCLNNSII